MSADTSFAHNPEQNKRAGLASHESTGTGLRTSEPVDRTAGITTDIDRSIATAAAALFANQRPNRSWEGFVPSSPIATAAVIIAFRTADPDGSRHLVERAVDWIVEVQNPDGGWGDVPGGRSTVNATAIALSAITMARPAAKVVIDRAKATLGRLGGQEAVEDKKRATLNPGPQVALALAGLFDPARVMRIPIEIALLPERMQRRISFGRPGICALALMQSRTRPPGSPRRRLRTLAERRALRYLRRLREFEGPEGGCEESCLAVAFIVIGLVVAGVGEDIYLPYLDYLARSVRPDGSWPIVRDLELSGTCQVVGGLWEAGFGDDQRLRSTAAWITSHQRDVPLPAAGARTSGWGWSLPSSWPDVEDSALALLALHRLGTPADDGHVRRGVRWLRSMQNRNGSWGCFVRSNRSSFDAQPDGAMSSVWFRDLTAGTAQVLEALGELGLAAHPVAQGCLWWLVDHQLPDGGWDDGSGGPATVEETAFALRRLASAGQARHPAAAAAARWLVSRQRPDGRWDPSDVLYYVDGVTYWCAAVVDGFALQALARYREEVR